MKFYIEIEEMRSTVVEIEAETSEEAIHKAEKAYSEDEICLNSVDYIDDGTCFYEETEKWARCIEKGYKAHFQKINGEKKTDIKEHKVDACPVCGANIVPKDGEDNGYGELYLHWECKECGCKGKAIIDTHNQNAFLFHELD